MKSLRHGQRRPTHPGELADHAAGRGPVGSESAPGAARRDQSRGRVISGITAPNPARRSRSSRIGGAISFLQRCRARRYTPPRTPPRPRSRTTRGCALKNPLRVPETGASHWCTSFLEAPAPWVFRHPKPRPKSTRCLFVTERRKTSGILERCLQAEAALGRLNARGNSVRLLEVVDHGFFHQRFEGLLDHFAMLGMRQVVP